MGNKKKKLTKFPLPENREFYIVHDEKGRGDSVSYWFRSPRGSLIELTAGTVDAARRRRDQWLTNRSQPVPESNVFHEVEIDSLDLKEKYN